MMNAADFQRNFTHSFLALRLTPYLKDWIEESDYATDIKDRITLDESYLYPAVGPKYLDSQRVMLTMIYPVKPTQGQGFVGYDSIKVMLPWSEALVDNKEMLKASVPSTGMLQINQHVVYAARIPVREPTHHGYSPQHHMFNWIGIPPEYYIETSDRPVTWRVYNKLRFDWNTAIDLLNKGEKFCCVVDRFLALGMLHNRRLTQIFYKRNNIGFVRDDGQPVLVPEYDNPTIQDYILKLSGVHPISR